MKRTDREILSDICCCRLQIAQSISKSMAKRLACHLGDRIAKLEAELGRKPTEQELREMVPDPLKEIFGGKP